MRESPHSSPSPSPAKKKLPPPLPKDPDENFLSYQEIVNRRGEAENNLSNSAKHFMSPTISTASREKGVAERNESDLFLDDSSPVRRHVVRRREITEKGMKEAPISGDFETEKKVGCCSSVCARVCEFLLILMILVLSTAYITSLNYPLGIDCSYHHHHHHHHYLEFDSYPVAFLRRTEFINGTPSHFQVAEPAAAPTTENKEIAQGDAAMHDVSEIEGEDLSPEVASSVAAAKPLIRKMDYDYDDDGNSTSSIVQMIVVTAIGSGMVLLVLISCMLVRKRRNAVAGYYHQYQRHVEPSLVRRHDPVMPERWSSVIDKRARSHGGL
ncbi:hypothetical protein LINPERHAP1_LOCUS32334 [Linum perenne]